MIEEQVVPIGRTRKVLLRVTPRARQQLGIRGSRIERESIAHEYWKRFCVDKYRKLGYLVELEALRQKGRVDVLARKGDERVAIEIETGKSDVVENVRQDLLSGFNMILVVATDEAALRKIEQQLAKAGLLIPSRVKVVLRDEGQEKG